MQLVEPPEDCTCVWSDGWLHQTVSLHNINLPNTFLFQAELSIIPHNLPLQITWTDPLPLLPSLNLGICL